MRRLIFAYAVVLMNDNFAGQIALILLQVLASLMILSLLEALIDRRRHNMELFNELIMLLTLYTIMCFSDWLDDQEFQFKIGYVACALIGFHSGLNLFLITVTTLRETKQRCRLCILRKRHKKARQALKARLEETRPTRKALRMTKQKNAKFLQKF